jgi:hypothetical protein
MKARVSSVFSVSADYAWLYVRKSGTLLYVTKGLLGFEGSNHFPYEWSEGSTIRTRLLFFGFIPAWRHELKFEKISDSSRTLYTNEGGGLVPVWNHLIKIESISEGSCPGLRQSDG